MSMDLYICCTFGVLFLLMMLEVYPIVKRTANWAFRA